MAIRKTFDLESGLQAEYWRLVGFLIPVQSSGQSAVEVYFDLYKDRNARSGGKEPVRKSACLTMEASVLSELLGNRNVLQILYALAMQTPHFAGGEEV